MSRRDGPGGAPTLSPRACNSRLGWTRRAGKSGRQLRSVLPRRDVLAARRLQQRPIVRLARPLREFVQTEAWAGFVLLVATLVALVWANGGWSSAYETLWRTEVALSAGRFSLSSDLRHWVNDGLMTVFFFVVGLEIKRELVSGELRDRRKAALPALAALGGMVVPALAYAALNHGGPGSAGWGIPMATDIAFALAVLTVLGARVPTGLKVFLVSLAIIDDVGAIVVIAAFYSGGVAWPALALAAGLLGVIAALRGLGVRWVPVYVIVGSAVWLATLESGVHATIAGVALALLTPARPLGREGDEGHDVGDHPSGVPSVQQVRTATFATREMVSPAERIEHLLHPWAGFLIVPVFALANAGIRVSPATVGAALSSPVGLGVVLGLVVGKPVGVLAFSVLGVRLRLASLPEGVGWRHVSGAAALAGIGFTVSLFIAGLAFAGGELTGHAKVAILLGSYASALAGAAVLLLVSRRPGASKRPEREAEDAAPEPSTD